MALRDKLHHRVQPFLEPGEQVQQVFLAQTGPDPNLMYFTWLITFLTQYRVVAVTDRAVVALAAGRWRPSFPKSVVTRLTRQLRLGPTSGGLWSALNLPGPKRTWVHRRFFPDIAAADAALGASPAPVAMPPTLPPPPPVTAG